MKMPYKILLSSLFLFLSSALLAQMQKEDTLTEMQTKPKKLRTVVISASRIPEDKMNTTQQVEVLLGEDILRRNTQSVPQLLMESGAVFIQKSQLGGGSPVIRGFEASRVLLVLDNIRLNNLIYRAGHLHNSVTLDQFTLDRVEVLYGPSSTLYGSDALGGLIHFYTKSPLLRYHTDTTLLVKSNLISRYGSVNQEKTIHLDVNLGHQNWASYSSLTFSSFSDLKRGRRSNPFLKNDAYLRREFFVTREEGVDLVVPITDSRVQLGTGYSQYNLMQKFLYKKKEDLIQKLQVQYSSSSDIPRYDRLSQMKNGKPEYAEWYYGPQAHFLSSYELKKRDFLSFDEVDLQLNYQHLTESRHSRKLFSDVRKNQLEKVEVVGLLLNSEKTLNEKHRICLGVDAYLNFLKSTAFDLNINTEEKKGGGTRYPDGDNRMHNIDAYATHQYKPTDKWVLNSGIRLGYSSLFSSFLDPTQFAFLTGAILQENFTYSGGVGASYFLSKEEKISVMLSSAFRVPNIDDLAKVFDSKPGVLIIPNPHIKPEKTLNLDIAYDISGEALGVESGVYGTYYFDAIVLGKTSFQGSDSVMFDGEMSGVYSNMNKQRAFLLGYSTSVKAFINDYLTWSASLNYTFGRIIEDTAFSPLDHIPPLFGRTGILYRSLDKKWLFEFFSLFNGFKSISNYQINGEDNIQYATQKGVDGVGLPAWVTFNLHADYAFNAHFSVQTRVENILDTEYRTFSSGISAPGRGYSIMLRLSF